MQLFLLVVLELLQLLAEGRRAENATQALGGITQALAALAVECLGTRVVTARRLAAEQARHGAAAEDPAIATALPPLSLELKTWAMKLGARAPLLMKMLPVGGNPAPISRCSNKGGKPRGEPRLPEGGPKTIGCNGWFGWLRTGPVGPLTRNCGSPPVATVAIA